MRHSPTVPASLSGRRVLVTGATGFIGRHLCEALVAGGAQVHGLSRGASAAVLPEAVRPKRLDLGDHESLEAFVAELRPDVVFHLAGLVTARQDLELVGPTLRCNLIGTVNALSAAARAGCGRFVYLSSFEENFEQRPDKAPASPYAAAKSAGGIYAQMFHKLYALPTVLVRPFIVYGPRQDAAKLIPYTILSFLDGRAPRLSSGRRTCDFIHVRDVVEALLRAAVSPDAVGQTVDLGTGVGTRIDELADILIELTGSDRKPIYGALPERVGEESRAVDCARARRLLDWSPRRSLRDGLAETVSWYRESFADRPTAAL